MAENLLHDTWADLDQADLRLLLEERIGGPGQRDGKSNVLYLPLARENCRVFLTYKGSKIVAIEPGKAFDRSKWDRICQEIKTSVLAGPQKVGRDISFSTFRVEGWWHGVQSGVQILPPPNNAPLARDLADNPFILEFPIQEAPGLQSITNHRRRREHWKLTLLLNLLLAGTTKFLPDRRKHFWACVQSEPKLEFKWVPEWYDADLGQIILSKVSPPTGEQIAELEPDRYYEEVGHDGQGLRVPSDLDEMIYRYQKLSPTLQEKFDRATYWLSMASRQWEDSMSASYASLVSSAEALTTEESSTHSVYCDECKENRSHDVPGATEKFRAFFEKYTPDPGLRERRNKMYGLRSKILHGSDLMQLDQGRALGWDPPWWDEREMTTELWTLMRIAARNWLRAPPSE